MLEYASKTPPVTKRRILLITKLPAKESYADDMSDQFSSNSEVQNATISTKKGIMESKDADKERKAAAKTQKEVEDHQPFDAVAVL